MAEEDGELMLYDVVGGAPARKLTSLPTPVWARYAADGASIYATAAGGGQTLEVIDATSGQTLRVFEGPGQIAS